MFLHEIQKKGWPCIIKEKLTSVMYIHNHNDMSELNCKGYSVENKIVQKRCDQYINETSLKLSSVFEK